MNPVPQPLAPRRRVWRWVLLGAGICLTPFVLLAIAAISFLTLNSDAAVLRKQVMAAADADWHTRVQLSVGGITLGVLRQGLHFVHARDIEEARLALGAVRHASVGVYERTSGPADWSRPQLFADTDQAMGRRGWTRLVGVADNKDTVLIYVPQDMDTDGPVEMCLAVVNGRELVVVSTSVDAAMLAELVKQHIDHDGKGHLHFAKFKL
ncbi:MAG TPA: hypothetical protein VKC51_01260 [Lacunisphaera sp.]|nr:hypothetical protein [Lacunisphaera sp.]